jgi:hypothetical protein
VYCFKPLHIIHKYKNINFFKQTNFSINVWLNGKYILSYLSYGNGWDGKWFESSSHTNDLISLVKNVTNYGNPCQPITKKSYVLRVKPGKWLQLETYFCILGRVLVRVGSPKEGPLEAPLTQRRSPASG